MKLCTFHHGGATRIGVITDEGIADLAAAAPELPSEMGGLLAAGPAALRRAASAASNAKSRLALDSTRLAARRSAAGPAASSALISLGSSGAAAARSAIPSSVMTPIRVAPPWWKVQSFIVFFSVRSCGPGVRHVAHWRIHQASESPRSWSSFSLTSLGWWTCFGGEWKVW